LFGATRHMIIVMPQASTSKFGRWLLVVGCLATVVLGVWAYRVYAWYTAGHSASLKAKQAFVLNPANQPAILQACRTMLATPGAFPQPAGDPFPKGMPPALASLGADSVTIYPNQGVLIMFGRDFGLWAVPASATAPNLPVPTARPLIPGLWYLTYPGN
jgi:hypothetical protein